MTKKSGIGKGAVILFSYDNEVYIMTDQDTKSVVGFKNSVTAARHFEQPYFERTMGDNYERSASACIHFIFFTPKVMEFDGINNLAKLLAPPPYDVYTCHTVAGQMTGIKCNEEGKKAYESAIEIKLMPTPRWRVEPA
jgi:hypothetical protein